MPLSTDDLLARAKRVRLLLFDVDGVLTDGTVAIETTGTEAKNFSIRDGAGMVWAMKQGLEVGFLSGRPSAATSRRATELGISIVVQGGPDKRLGFNDILGRHGFQESDVAYMGDDLLDLPILARAGLSAAPADAITEVRDRVHWVSGFGGGRGAARELIELVLRAQGTWDTVVRSLTS